MYANINGTRIHYLVEGEGQPCMMAVLAGTPIYDQSFRIFAPHFAQRTRSVLLPVKHRRMVEMLFEALV